MECVKRWLLAMLHNVNTSVGWPCLFRVLAGLFSGDSDRGASHPERRQWACALSSLREKFEIADLRFQICQLKFAICHPEGAAFAPPAHSLSTQCRTFSPEHE